MTRRPYHRPPAGRAAAHHDRRAALDVLLARAQRGALSLTEAAHLAEHVREETRIADENRRAMSGTTRALARHREAADAAIREWEQRALDAEEQLTAWKSVFGIGGLETYRAALARAEEAKAERDHEAATREQAQQDADRYRADYLSACETIADMHRAATGRTGMAPIRGVVEDVADVRARAEQAERQVGILLAVDEGRAHGAQRIMNERDQAQQRAKTAETAASRSEQAAEQHRRNLSDALRLGTGASWGAIRNRATELATAAAYRQANAEQPTAGTIEFAEQERARFERLYTRETVRADEAEADRDKARQHADTYRAAWHSARDRAGKHAQHVERLKNSNQRWYSTATEQRRRANALVIELTRERKAAQRLDAMRQRVEQPGPEVITDRATIRNTLNEPEPAPRPTAFECEPGNRCHRCAVCWS
ncbi:hypothetical protein [Streptomyces sp. TP-A0875]|uniref:hypothetical protein n=1 Tax=Streptomyces sp. TP-A0875 TaxID=552354 RepID=UPI0006B4F434|nr:hypothetical protein [Streptomyces sp. TP-A0875]